jgi:hypothetical protein
MIFVFVDSNSSISVIVHNQTHFHMNFSFNMTDVITSQNWPFLLNHPSYILQNSRGSSLRSSILHTYYVGKLSWWRKSVSTKFVGFRKFSLFLWQIESSAFFIVQRKKSFYQAWELNCEKAQSSDNTTQHNTIQHNSAQHSAIKHNKIQHNSTQYNTTRHKTTQYKTTQHRSTQYNTTRQNATQYNTIHHNTTQYNTTQYNTTQYNTAQHNTTQHNKHNIIQYNTHMTADRTIQVTLFVRGKYKLWSLLC